MSETPKTELERLKALEYRGSQSTNHCPVCGEHQDEKGHAEDCWLHKRILELVALEHILDRTAVELGRPPPPGPLRAGETTGPVSWNEAKAAISACRQAIDP